METVNSSMSENELLLAVEEALRGAHETPDNARTVAEIARETGERKRNIRATLADMKAKGRLRAIRVKREAIDLSMRWTTAYQIVGPSEDGAG